MSECFVGTEAIAAIVGVAVGAAISGVGKLLSRCERQKQIKATVKHDIHALWNRIYPEVRSFMGECYEDRKSRTVKAQLSHIGISQNYFSCFEAIAGEIAVLPDADLSQEVFDTYATARGVVDTVLTNNQIASAEERMIYGQRVYDDLVELQTKIKNLTDKL